MLRAPLYLCVRVYPESSVCAHSSRQKYIDKNSTKFTVFWQSIFRYLSNLIANQAEVEIIQVEEEKRRHCKLQLSSNEKCECDVSCDRRRFGKVVQR